MAVSLGVSLGEAKCYSQDTEQEQWQLQSSFIHLNTTDIAYFKCPMLLKTKIMITLKITAQDIYFSIQMEFIGWS